jgi:hypothetical protein
LRNWKRLGEGYPRESRARREVVGSKILSAAEILAADDLQTVDVEVPEWGGVVRLRSLTGEEISKIIDATSQRGADRALQIVALCAIDEKGATLFTSEQLADLQKKNLKVLLRLQTAAMRLNDLDAGGEAEAKND